MFNPKEFLAETIVRLFSKSPKYFVYLQWATAILAIVPFVVEQALPFLKVDVPSWLHSFNDLSVKGTLAAMWLMARLTKKDPNEVEQK